MVTRCELPQANGLWWVATQERPMRCRECGQLVLDRPAVMSYDAKQDFRGDQARLHPGWVRLGWLWWQDCSACGAIQFDRAVSAAQIRDWSAGPWQCDEM
jgi:hypothetical protein